MPDLNHDIDIFVPGRLCLFGEHTDWAGRYRTVNSKISLGIAIVSGIDQGIYAKVKKNDQFVVKTILDDGTEMSFHSAMNIKELKRIAAEGGFFSYVAGAASYMKEHYNVGGLEISIEKITLPMKKGLSSSAAISVLVVRAFNMIYKLQMSVRGEMNAAYFGEQRTPSRCGRMDQACAFGKRPICMTFDGNDIEVTRLKIKNEFNWVFADLKSQKNTIKILSDLNKCYPFPSNDLEIHVHQALGEDNQIIVKKAIQILENGTPEELGKIMNEAQKVFDEKISPACKEELEAPVLHKLLEDPKVKELTYGGKGVGSQGDGTIQFIAKNIAMQQQLIDYLNQDLGLQAYPFDIKPQKSVRKAIIPVAGFGTRLYPASRIIKKEFFPVVDQDGYVKPAILILLEELDRAGIEEICLVIGEHEKELYDKFFNESLSEEHLSKLPSTMRTYEAKIQDFGTKIKYIIQKERLGFGHAVYQCKEFANEEPVLLMLGDHIYKSFSGQCCAQQITEMFDKTGMLTIAVHPMDLKNVDKYGIVTGSWENEEETILNVSEMVEKPSCDFAQEFLAVPLKNGEKNYFSAFGQYVLTAAVFEELEKNINSRCTKKGEYQLTDALDQVREKVGMVAFLPEGQCFDIGIPEAYVKTIGDFYHPID